MTAGRSAPAVRAGVPAALALAALLLLLLPQAVRGVERTTVFSPAAGAQVREAFTVVVDVDAEPGEVIERVEVALNGPSNLLVEAAPSGPPDVDGVQRWTVQIDPRDADADADGDGVVLANGAHRLTARPVPSVGDAPPFTGHEITLAVATTTTIDARPDPDDGLTALVSWAPADAPDVVAYRVERRPDEDGGRWSSVAEVSSTAVDEDGQAVTEVADTPAEAGAWRYRVVVVRPDGDGGEVLGASGTRGVLTDPESPRTFDPPQGDEPAPRSTPEPSAEPTADDDGQAAGPAQGTAGPIGRPGAQPTTQPNTGTGQVAGPTPRPLPVTARPPSTAGPAPRPVAPVVPFNDGVFETELPVAQGSASRTITETESAMIGGSRSSGGSRNVLREEVNRDGWTSVALSVLLLVCAAHVRRFMGDAARG